MRAAEAQRVGAALGSAVLESRVLAGGFSHETCLLKLADGQVVARFGGSDPATEAAVMAVAGSLVPVPRVLAVLPSGATARDDEPDGSRAAMVIEYVDGTLLSQVLADSELTREDFAALGAKVGEVAAQIAAVTFERPGFFAGRRLAGRELAVRAERPWSQQLPEFAATCMERVPQARLAAPARLAWTELCAAHAGALTAVDDQARLVHADLNPKNLLVTQAGRGGRPGRDWRVAAVLDWEFSFSGCPYGDAANLARFGAAYPAGFLDSFLKSFAERQPADLPPPENWLYLGRVLDMFALSDLVTRPAGHLVADQAAGVIGQWLDSGVPDRT